MREGSEVCVVGGGPAGLTVALTLQAAGRRVLLLESGGIAPKPDVQELNDGEHEGEPYIGLARTRQRQLGGTPNIWDVRAYGKPAAKYVPLDQKDVADWPIGWEELEPFYAEAQDVCGLGPFDYGWERWATPECEPFQLEGTGLASAVYHFGYSERFTHELVDELHAAESVSVATATVVELLVDRATRRLRGVRAVTGDGGVVDVEAQVVVLACGAVENARLLLLAGLGDPGGAEWLGRCFMEHPRNFSLVLVPSSPELFSRAGFYDLRTSDDGFLVGGRLTLTDEARDRHELPNGSITLVPRTRLTRRRRLVQRAPGPLRRLLKTRPPDRYGWSRLSAWANFDRIQLILNLEQRPDARNRIELGSRRDRFGNPLPRLFLHWTDEEQKSLEQLHELLREWLRAAGIGELMIKPGRRADMNGHHHAGTTRMALDRKDGVVDPDGRVFGIDNLYVAGASVFPSAGFANPTLTIVALARRLGRHLAREHAA